MKPRISPRHYLHLSIRLPAMDKLDLLLLQNDFFHIGTMTPVSYKSLMMTLSSDPKVKSLERVL